VKERVRASAAQLGIYAKSNENADVDASALWLSTPFRVVEPTDRSYVRTVASIEEQLSLVGGIRRYPTDIYYGSGAWPVLTASLGWHYLTVGDLEGARRCHEWISERFDEEGRLGEQFGGELRDAPHFREWSTDGARQHGTLRGRTPCTSCCRLRSNHLMAPTKAA